MPNNTNHYLAQALWKIYNRPAQTQPWAAGSDLFWNDPLLSERILREHLDNTHGAASREETERLAQIEWLWHKLNLRPNAHLFDITCGPGLYAVDFARRGCTVTANDFNPAAIAYAQDLALIEGLTARCTFIEQDIRHMDYQGADFDAAILLYGQLAIFPPPEAQTLLTTIAQSLKPEAGLCLELLNQTHVDQTDSSWWFTDNSGLWGDGPFLHLGERTWHPQQQASVERYQIIHLQNGHLTSMQMTDQTYPTETMTQMLKQAGFTNVQIYPAWDTLPLADAQEWLVYIAFK